MVYSTIALVLQGYPLDHPVLAAAIAGLDAFALEDDHGRQDRGVPVSCLGHRSGGYRIGRCRYGSGRPRHEGGTGLAARRRGDSRRRLGGPPAQPCARRLGIRVPERPLPRHRRHRRSGPGSSPRRRACSDAACDRAVDWLVGMQSSDGGWGAFDADNTSTLPTQLPFFDFGAVTDPPTADVTAHVVEMLACEPHPLSAGLARMLSSEASTACRPPGAQRVILGTLGCQLRLRDGCRSAGSYRRRSTRQGPDRGRRCPVARGPPEPRRRLG